jgi:hypothetical protein
MRRNGVRAVVLRAMRPRADRTGKIAYRPLSVTTLRVIRKPSTHVRYTPMSPKPSTVKPLTSTPCRRRPLTPHGGSSTSTGASESSGETQMPSV